MASPPFTYDGGGYDGDLASPVPRCAFSRVRIAIALFSLALLREIAIAPPPPPPPYGPVRGPPAPPPPPLRPATTLPKADHLSPS
jgi:hypothetical protein